MMDVSHDRSRTQPTLVAVDLGAESCRVSLLRWINGQPGIRLAHRFPNSAKNVGDGLRWDIAALCEGVDKGLRSCANLAPGGIAAIGVDGWAAWGARVSFSAAGEGVKVPEYISPLA